MRGRRRRVAASPRLLPTEGKVGFEAIITFGLILMILNLADGPKLNGPFVPLAIGAYVIAWATMGGPYEGGLPRIRLRSVRCALRN